MASFSQKKSAMAMVKIGKHGLAPLISESISGQTRNGPLYEILNMPLRGNIK